MELKHNSSALGLFIMIFQSDHYGIETIVQLMNCLIFTDFQSDHYGIETGEFAPLYRWQWSFNQTTMELKLQVKLTPFM